MPANNPSFTSSPTPQSPLPVPPSPAAPQNHLSLWIAFEYILMFIALYISTISLSGIAHHAVDNFFKESLTKYSYFDEAQRILLRGFIAAIIVFYPIFVFLFLHLKKQELIHPIVKQIRSRKICIYITLIITFLISMGNITSTIYGFLAGTSTLNSLMHLLTTLAIAGGIFFYYLFEVKEDRKINESI